MGCTNITHPIQLATLNVCNVINLDGYWMLLIEDILLQPCMS